MLELKRKEGKIWSHVRNNWFVETPEETIRQEFLLHLVNNIGYKLDQIKEEESVVGRGSAQARADFLIWKSKEDKIKEIPAFMVIECKADYISISTKDYFQGENYARREGAELFVTHNSKETKIFKVLTDRRPGYFQEIEKIPNAEEIKDEKKLKEIYNKLKVFEEDEFARKLRNCHNIIRNREKLDPAAAFDEIAKILFMKVFAERKLRNGEMKGNIFSLEWVNKAEEFNPDYLTDMFNKTKVEFAKDKIFKKDEKINLRVETIKSIIKELEVYNLSRTSSDIKGIAFEKFLGRTFRGEIGQFFTPRPLVNFMVDFLHPKYSEVICDPASGSGGFLIKCFENMRNQIELEAQEEYNSYVSELNETDEIKKANLLKEKQKEIYEKYLNQENPNSKLWFLSWRSIYGTDANERMARTSKMNMIMHGDGHGGIHHNDGLYDVNGVFEGRFNVILTNPPFGASVEKDDKIQFEDNVFDLETKKYYEKTYGDTYKNAVSMWESRHGESIGKYYDIVNSDTGKTEVFFLERCLNLLADGGRMGIVLPEGILNNPSLQKVREFCEGRAKILAIISVPQEVFVSSKASVKTSIVFMQKFTEEDKKKYEEAKLKAENNVLKQENLQKLQEEINLYQKEYDETKKPTKELKTKLNNLKKEFNKLLEEELKIEIKKEFNYKIFMAEVEHAGINSVGEIDEESNELPKIVEEYRKFEKDPENYIGE